MFLRLPTSTLFPYTTLFRSEHIGFDRPVHEGPHIGGGHRRIANVGAELLDLLLETLGVAARRRRSEEHTSELQSPYDLVCRLLLEKKTIKVLRCFNLSIISL